MTFTEIFFKQAFPEHGRITRKNDIYMVGADENKVFSENEKKKKKKKKKEQA